jgi:uncharacterized membrane protein
MTPAIGLHLATALAALVVGLAILARAKGTAAHKTLGRVWVGAVAATAIVSFAIRGDGGFSWIHALSVWSLISIAMGVAAIRRGNVQGHRAWMLSLYAGVAIAGAFTLLPSRLLGKFVFGA